MKKICKISKMLILLILLANMTILLTNIANAQDNTTSANAQENITIANAQDNTTRTGVTKDLVVYLPVSKTIDGINDALIDIMMQNPSNENMNVEINITPPSNIYIYGGPEFNQSGNNYVGDFIIDPGQNNTAEIRIKSDTVGNYTLDFNGQYWFGAHPSRYNIKPYSQVIEVKVPSINAKEGPSSPVTPPGIPDNTLTTPGTPENTMTPENTLTPENTPNTTSTTTNTTPDISIGLVFLVISLVYLYRRRR